jgi:hypothetical protein
LIKAQIPTIESWSYCPKELNKSYSIAKVIKYLFQNKIKRFYIDPDFNILEYESEYNSDYNLQCYAEKNIHF